MATEYEMHRKSNQNIQVLEDKLCVILHGVFSLAHSWSCFSRWLVILVYMLRFLKACQDENHGVAV
jgi:hypothetical protein